MLKFKKRYENQIIVLASGLLIDRFSIGRASVQKALKVNKAFAYMFEEAAESKAAAVDPPEQPGTGGGGAGDPRPKPTTSTRKRTKK